MQLLAAELLDGLQQAVDAETDLAAGAGGTHDEMHVTGAQLSGLTNDLDHALLHLGGALAIAIDQAVHGDGAVKLVNGLQVGEVELVSEATAFETVDERQNVYVVLVALR
ncbi:hypothetical protein [Pseudomonas aeruginosa]|uniref:hypothetical protein n=1 Tax=Pseudomonas aeruginosa TaxID=287 RepID=UPI002341B33D|nr:hypothetical protein [Pseudomonas aeruginosa]